MINLLKSVITYIVWIILTIIFLPISILITYFPNRYENRFYFFITNIWNILFFRKSFIDFEVIGLENIPSTPSIFIANHASALDIPVLEYVVGRMPHVWISKYEYLKMPLFGRLLSRMHVPVNRENPALAAKAFAKLYAIAKQHKSHITMFPEGTRSLDGKRLPFNSGFAILAKKLNRPIIPVSIQGLDKVFPKGSWVINFNVKVKIIVGDSILPLRGARELALDAEAWFDSVCVDDLYS